MRELGSDIFKNKKMNIDKLVAFGFKKTADCYRYEKSLNINNFSVIVEITETNSVLVDVIDNEMNESYTLYLVDGATGDFVGQVREEVDTLLKDIADYCYDFDVFKSEMCKRVIEYVRFKYGDELEFLWQKFSNNAIWRRKDTQKWYGAVLIVSKRKLGIDSDEKVEILDFRVKSNDMVDFQKYYPGYHMNKKYWCTLILDGSVSFEEICERIDGSYALAKNK